MGISSTSKKGGTAAPFHFSTDVYRGEAARWIKVTLGTEVGLGPGHTVLDRDPALSPLPPKGAQQPPLFGHVYCGHTAAWIKMPLGMEVGLEPGQIVLDGVPAPPPWKGAQQLPTFAVYGRMDQHSPWYTGRPRPRLHSVTWEPTPPQKGGQQLPNFSAHV